MTEEAQSDADEFWSDGNGCTRVGRDSALLKAHALIDWEGLRVELCGLCKREASRAGRQKPIDPLTMFKAVLLEQWHNLSYLKLEEALRVWIDFMYFCGLSLTDDVPDETALCRFRSCLITTDKLGGLLGLINGQLQAHGLMVKYACGAVIDTILVQLAGPPTATQPLSWMQRMQARLMKRAAYRVALTHGSPEGAVHVRAFLEQNLFELSVTNSGRPIPPEALEKLFQPFTRQDVSSSQNGLGLGLYIASEIARAHKGELTVASNAEETCFTFRMPTSA